MLIHPCPKGVITSGFGLRPEGYHGGVDMGTPVGTPIFAAADGRVERASFHDEFGKVVIIRHTDGTATIYAHLSGYSVGLGDHLTAGQTLGLSGNTGRSSGPHLHFEVLNLPAEVKISPRGNLGFYPRKYAVDPVRLLPEATGHPTKEEATAMMDYARAIKISAEELLERIGSYLEKLSEYAGIGTGNDDDRLGETATPEESSLRPAGTAAANRSPTTSRPRSKSATRSRTKSSSRTTARSTARTG